MCTDAPVAFEGPAIAIRRETGLSPEGAYPSQGREAFLASELPRLSQVLSGSEKNRAKFKIMHLELKGSKVLSKMLFEMRGRRPAAGWKQITAKWHCEWIQRESGPELQTVRVTDYQEASPGTWIEGPWPPTPTVMIDKLMSFGHPRRAREYLDAFAVSSDARSNHGLADSYFLVANELRT